MYHGQRLFREVKPEKIVWYNGFFNFFFKSRLKLTHTGLQDTYAITDTSSRTVCHRKHAVSL